MEQKQQIADRLKQANNILVTVSNNPSVDQLAACIGLTLTFNKMGKHATAVFSGQVPDTIEFLEPEKTIAANTDSLRDFIISLDKSKADKLRYKVEDKVVKIFITPYRTSINEKDLEFGQGDFNVDVVLALGVHDQGELDQAITAHGRILHDATVATINIKPGGELGSINWLVPAASSLSELSVDLIDSIDKKMVDGQIATAFLTGIVAETSRFSNEKTSPDTMSISAELMAAGANQQLVATKLEPKPEPPPPPPEPQQPPAAPAPEQNAANGQPTAQPEEKKPDDGTLEIAHDDDKKDEDENKPAPSLDDLEAENENSDKDLTPRIHIDEQGSLRNIEEKEAEAKSQEDKPEDSGQNNGTIDPNQHMGSSRAILQPPNSGEPAKPAESAGQDFSDPLSLPKPGGDMGGQAGQNAENPSGNTSTPAASATITPPATPFMPSSMTPGAPSLKSSDPSDQASGAASSPQPSDDQKPETPSQDGGNVDDARGVVNQAFASGQHEKRLEPIHALNAQPLGDQLHAPAQPDNNAAPEVSAPVAPGPSQSPGSVVAPPSGTPPPVPPPMMPPQQ